MFQPVHKGPRWSVWAKIGGRDSWHRSCKITFWHSKETSKVEGSNRRTKLFRGFAFKLHCANNLESLVEEWTKLFRLFLATIWHISFAAEWSSMLTTWRVWWRREQLTILKDLFLATIWHICCRMEQYANNLESLVEERTADYLKGFVFSYNMTYLLQNGAVC